MGPFMSQVSFKAEVSNLNDVIRLNYKVCAHRSAPQL